MSEGSKNPDKISYTLSAAKSVGDALQVTVTLKKDSVEKTVSFEFRPQWIHWEKPDDWAKVEVRARRWLAQDLNTEAKKVLWAVGNEVLSEPAATKFDVASAPTVTAFFEHAEYDEVQFDFESTAEYRDFLNENKHLKLLSQMLTTGELLVGNISDFSDEQCARIDCTSRNFMEMNNELYGST